MVQVNRGYFKGTKLKAPKSQQTRPTSSKVKEAVVNLIGGDVNGWNVLDLYAGTGSMGIEFLSIGANHCDFVEMDKEAIRCLESNLALIMERAKKQSLDLTTKIIRRSSEKFLSLNNNQYDLVWADPPYALIRGYSDEFIASLERQVYSGGYLVLEASREGAEFYLSRLRGGWNNEKNKNYGDTHILVFRREID